MFVCCYKAQEPFQSLAGKAPVVIVLNVDHKSVFPASWNHLQQPSQAVVKCFIIPENNSSMALMYTKLVEIQISSEIFRNYLTK
jgi:hypothetical protein